MKLKKITLIVCGISILFTACDWKKEGGKMGGKNVERLYELTEDQEELLCKISIDDERIKEGKLDEWQIEVLNQYNYAMEYLKKKYPSYSFMITTCAEKNLVNAYTTFGFIEKDEEEGYYEIYMDVEEGENGNIYSAKDNYFGEIKEDEFAQKMKELIQEEFGNDIEIQTKIPYVMDEQFDEQFDFEKVMNGKIQMPHITTFTMKTNGMKEEEYKKREEKIRELIEKKGIHGTYRVEFLDNVNAEEILYKNYFYE